MIASHPRCSSIDLDSPDRPFDNIINFRDVGRSINRLMGKKKVLALAASGYRSDAVLIVGEHVMSPRGLIGLGQDTLDSSTVEMREIFDLLASRNEGEDRTYPVLVHCTQGKDRTGLVVLMLLLLSGVVSDEAMLADYVRSEPELVVEVEERMKEIRKLGLSEEYTKCPDGFTTEIRRHLEERYGGVEGYLRSAGVREEKLEMIREVLIA
ncbi:hypothetical protein ETB97_003048 [Aspergillus alliaceus]|uniref:Tyrosine specific protein phosphatases domain-containing protein n=1 Tax=Petromyces alliaceus TaxID=209559 RepID=A0A8H6AEN0_PETAA|nr:hypothetical protein ETB97_003048 [Aspergillus burnettii]